MKKICVIILSWNRKEDTLETISSLAKSTISGFEMEIMVVDNGSTDGSQQAIKTLLEKVDKPPKLTARLITLYENLGFAEGNNIGMRDALDRDFDYIALLNDDTIVNKNLIRKIFLEHKRIKNAGAISPKIYFAKGFEFHNKRYKKNELGKVFWYAGGGIDWDNVYGYNEGVDEVDKGQFNKVREVDFATGCFVMYKRRALEEAGLYDKRYFAYMEDADHAQRVKKAGWKIIYSPKGHLWHKVAQSSGIGSELNDYFLTRNRMIFGIKHARLRAKFALIRESLKLLVKGRKWQKVGIRDFYLRRFGKGSWPPIKKVMAFRDQ